MLTIFNDPTGATGHRRIEWDRNLTIQQNIELHLQSGGDCEVFVNGLRIDPGSDPVMDRIPSVLDEVRVCRRPEGFDPFTLAVIAVIAAVAISYALIPKLPSVGGVGKDSPNNSLTAQTNVARAYQAIPDVYGYRRVWPDLIQPSTVEYINHIKYVTEWMCVSRGQGTISAVQYAETPIVDIAGASYEVFEPAAGPGYPENRTTTLLDVFETFASDEVNGQEIPYPSGPATVNTVGSFNALSGGSSMTVTVPDSASLATLKGLEGSGSARVVFTYGDGPTVFDQTCAVSDVNVAGSNVTFTFATTPWVLDASGSLINFSITPNLSTTYNTIGPFTLPVSGSRIRWNTVFLRGLKTVRGVNFNIPIVITAEWWQVDAAGSEIPGTRQSQDFGYSGDTYDARFWTNEVSPSAGPGRYRIQFTRKTAEVDPGGADVAKLEEVYAVRYSATKQLPGVTVVRVTTKATNEATGYSDRKFNLRWQRHVRHLGNESLSPSRNFGRALAHIWALSGADVADLDTDSLAEINERLGEDSPLLRFDGSLDDSDMSLGERLALIANHARCVVWRDGARWTVSRDEAKTFPEVQFDYRNLAGSGNSTIGYSAHMPDSNDGVEVEYVDELSQSKKTYVRLRVSSGAVVPGVAGNPKKLKLPGCTTLAQAENRAQLEARRILYQRDSISDTAMSDAGTVGPGTLVRYIDPNDFLGDDGLQAGEVLAISGSQITTSEPVDWKGQDSGRIQFTAADGARLGPPILCAPAGAAIALASVPTGLFVADGMTRQLGSRYAFAPGITEAEMESAGLYTVTDVKPEGDGKTSSIALIRYDARLYEFDA